MLNMRTIKSILVGLFMGITTSGLLVTPGQAAVTWTSDGTNVISAQGVTVNGTLYDVNFIDGNCFDIFTGCDNATADFTFDDALSASQAGMALANTVFTDTPMISLDTSPALTEGCEGIWSCNTFIPFGTDGTMVSFMAVANFPGDSTNPIFGSFMHVITLDTTALADGVYATFTETGPAPVPLPAALPLFVSALAGMGFIARRRKQAV